VSDVSEVDLNALVEQFTDILMYHMRDVCYPPLSSHSLRSVVPFGYGPKPSPAALRDITRKQVLDIIEGVC
jgi:hypothetical protein